LCYGSPMDSESKRVSVRGSESLAATVIVVVHIDLSMPYTKRCAWCERNHDTALIGVSSMSALAVQQYCSLPRHAVHMQCGGSI
jgi:hypothetical protein